MQRLRIVLLQRPAGTGARVLTVHHPDGEDTVVVAVGAVPGAAELEGEEQQRQPEVDEANDAEADAEALDGGVE